MIQPPCESERDTVSEPVMCGYCNVAAELVSGSMIYPWRFDLADLKFWRCPACGAYTGTHINSPIHAPKGGLAREPLRKARIAAHAAFDQRWKSGGENRSRAYAWLRDQLGMDRQPHIGFMDEAQCKRVVEVCRASPLVIPPQQPRERKTEGER